MPPRRESVSNSLLSPHVNDDDESSIRSLSEQDSDSEDDEFIQANHSSLELAQHDRQVLEEEEELEKLLTKSNPAPGLRRIFSPNDKFDQQSVRIGKKERRRRRREERRVLQRKQHGKSDEEGILLHEMEEGGFKDDTSSTSSTRSSEVDRAELDNYSSSKVGS